MILSPWPMILRSLPMTDFSPVDGALKGGLRTVRAVGTGCTAFDCLGLDCRATRKHEGLDVFAAENDLCLLQGSYPQPTPPAQARLGELRHACDFGTTITLRISPNWR